MIRTLHVAAVTNTGLHRKRNEDSLLVAEKVIAQASMESPRSFDISTFPVLLAVADGIGGSVAGDLASREVMKKLASPPCPEKEETLRERILSCGEHLDHLVEENPALEGMGTTLAGVLCTREDLFIFSSGDSRAYYALPGAKMPSLMTRDHSVVQEMIESGKLTEKEARKHPLGHIITSCLSGGKRHYPPDVRISRITPPAEGARLIICTDGVWDYGGDEFLQATIPGDPISTAKNILEICYAAGAPDNITLIIADMK